MNDEMTDQAERFPRRTLRRQNTHARILRAAMKLFRQVGYGAATMNAIAEAADVHVATLFVHFKSKLDLASSLNNASIERLEALASEAKGKVAFFTFFREIVMATARTLDGELDPGPTLWHELKREPELALAWSTYEQRQIAIFADYIAADYGLDVDTNYTPALVANLLMSSLWMSHRRWSESAGALDLTDETQKALNTAEAMALAVLKRGGGRRAR